MGVTYALDELNKVTYGYFRETCGLVNNKEEITKELKDAYKDHAKKDLKKELNKLKNQQPQDPIRIKYVAKLLRGKIQNKKVDVSSKNRYKKMTLHCNATFGVFVSAYSSNLTKQNRRFPNPPVRTIS